MNRKDSFTLMMLVPFFIQYGCSTQSESININPLETNSSSFTAKIVKYIPLSNQIEALIGSVERFIIGNSHIYVFDKRQTSGILIFSETGTFIRKISLGRGPGELINPNNFSVVDNQLIISDFNYLKHYNLDGEFLFSKELPLGWTFYSFENFNDKHLIVQGNTDSLIKQPSSKIQKYHIVNKKLSQSYMSYVETTDWLTSIFEKKPISYFNGKFLLLARPFNYIYQLDGKSLSEKYFIDFGSYNFTDADVSKGFEHILSLFRENRRMGLLDNLYENESLVCFSYASFANGSDVPVLFSKSTLETANFYEVLKNADLPKMDIVQALEDELICLFLPGNFDEATIGKYQSNGIIPKETTPDSNPIVFIIEISVKTKN